MPINERGSQGWTFFLTLTVVPTLLVATLLAYRLIALLVLAELVEGLHQLPPTLAIACVLVLAASVVVALAVRRR